MSDFGNRLEQARQKLPLHRLMEQYGKGPNGNGKSYSHCPFCSKKGGVGLFGEGAEERFKCHHANCPSGTQNDKGAWDQVGYLEYELKLNRKDAAVVFLKETGMWQEREQAPSIMPGKAGRKKPLPSEVETDRLKPGLHTEKNLASAAVPPVAAGCTSEGGGSLASQALEAAAGATRTGQPVRDTISQPVAPVEMLAGAPPKAAESDLDCLGPKPKATVPDQTGEDPPANIQSPTEALAIVPGAGVDSVEGATSKLPTDGTPPSVAVSKIVDMAGKPVLTESTKHQDPNSKEEVAQPTGGYIIELPAGARAMLEFFGRLTLSEGDEKVLFEKRGLESRTVAALQFRSNPKANKEILLALSSEVLPGRGYAWEDLYAAGLWLREDRKSKKERRPNAKFYGFGIAGKKANGDWEYKWNNPIIIPYFDEAGKLLSLRPHKDMGPGGTLTGTPHIYVPRAAKEKISPLPAGEALPVKPELFETVVITEGEFKAAALWQILGAGRLDGKEPIGVAALPGISFGKNYETREELDGWLRRVKCRCVKVIYDNEEKGNPKFAEAFKSDRRKRFDSQIWARYLATDIAQKLHIRGEVGMLPNEWQNNKGKADWDGAMAEFARAAA